MSEERRIEVSNEKAISVRASNWNSPRLIVIHKGNIFFQAATCYPCRVCNNRVQQLEMKISSNVTFYKEILNSSLFFVFPVSENILETLKKDVDKLCNYVENLVNLSITFQSMNTTISIPIPIPIPQENNNNNSNEVLPFQKTKEEWEEIFIQTNNELSSSHSSSFSSFSRISIALQHQITIIANIISNYNLNIASKMIAKFQEDEDKEKIFNMGRVGGMIARKIEQALPSLSNFLLYFFTVNTSNEDAALLNSFEVRRAFLLFDYFV